MAVVDDDEVCEDGCDPNAPHGLNTDEEMDVDDNDPAP
jgi:hypothetical protein